MHNGGVSKTINAIKSDSDHIPCVLIGEDNEKDKSVWDRPGSKP